jgi:hypothetical protein
MYVRHLRLCFHVARPANAGYTLPLRLLGQGPRMPPLALCFAILNVLAIARYI